MGTHQAQSLVYTGLTAFVGFGVCLGITYGMVDRACGKGSFTWSWIEELRDVISLQTLNPKRFRCVSLCSFGWLHGDLGSRGSGVQGTQNPKALTS